MTDKMKQTKAGATELTEEDLKKAQGGFVPIDIVGQVKKIPTAPGTTNLKAFDKNKDG